MRILAFVTVMLFGACAVEDRASSIGQAATCQLGQCDPGGDGDSWTPEACAQYTHDYATSQGAPLEIHVSCGQVTLYNGVRTRSCGVSFEAAGLWLTVYCDWTIHPDGTSTLDGCSAF